MTALRNPNDEDVRRMISASKHKAARAITTQDGTRWVWPAEDATHAEMAEQLGIAYDKKPGEGDILV